MVTVQCTTWQDNRNILDVLIFLQHIQTLDCFTVNHVSRKPVIQKTAALVDSLIALNKQGNIEVIEEQG